MHRYIPVMKVIIGMLMIANLAIGVVYGIPF
jgi:hypothetical protein